MSKPAASLHYAQPVTGLLLTGGGARAAYQVGVLQAVTDIRRACRAHHTPNPFGILSGTSAGSINAVALACGADHFDLAVQRLARHWCDLNVEGVYRADHSSLLRSGTRWLGLLALGWVFPRRRDLRPRSLLDNAPLRTRLQQALPMNRIPYLLEHGFLQAVAVTASSYTTGEHVTFFDARGDQLQAWKRSKRIARRATLTHEHLLASSAIPFVFPATALPAEAPTEYFGDGSMRQSAPLSPAIHLGAHRIMVVGAGRVIEPPAVRPDITPAYPSIAQIAGHALSSIFLDALPLDVERTLRINQTLSLVPPAQRAQSGLRPLELLVINPSDRLDALAAEHLHDLPPGMRNLFRVLGVDHRKTDAQSAALASYLMFTPAYIRALIAMGHQDTLARREDVVRFFGWHDHGVAVTPHRSPAHH